MVLLPPSPHADEEWADEGLGIDGHLLWDEVSSETIAPLLAAFLSGDVVIASRPVLAAFVRSRSRGRGCVSPCRDGEAAPPLSPRERAVLGGLVDGLTRPEVAAREGIAPRTVERIVADLQAKLEAPNPYALGAQAIRLGLLAACPTAPRATHPAATGTTSPAPAPAASCRFATPATPPAVSRQRLA